MSGGRPLRVLLVANDGLSAGHVARAIAIANALARVARGRDVALRTVLATTSQAHPLLGAAEAVVVQSPAPVVARRAGFTDAERRRLVGGVLGGVVRSFSPDLVVADTFPLGPHGELAAVELGHARRALVRRHVPDAVIDDPVLANGLAGVDLAIVADDPTPYARAPECPHVRVPPITLDLPCLSRREARAALALPLDARVILVAAGGGGDEIARGHAERIAEAILRSEPTSLVALARGPLAPAEPVGGPRLRAIQAAPLVPLLAAFDGAIVPAGYNTAHELALARVPTALFAAARPFDDQAARAERLGATLLRDFDDDAVADALARMRPLREVARGGAERAAEALLDLGTGQPPAAR